MEIVNLLTFLNNVKDLFALDYASCEGELVNFLDILSEDEQFIQKVDLGIVYVNQKTLDQYVVVDGLRRFLSLSLLLHAICECYKKTTTKNEKAILTIREKYLLNGSRTKLRLPKKMQDIYDKIIFGERLSGKEKESPMFILLHNFWSQIKEDRLSASNIFVMLKKISIYIVESSNIPQRDLYYNLNKDKREINQLALIRNYLKNIGLESQWDSLKKIYNNYEDDINLFFKDFFVTKFNFKEYKYDKLYEIFINYFETMLQYMPEDTLINRIRQSAINYNNILNVNINNENIKRKLIQIKMHNGEDTYAYLLSIYEDYLDNTITEATFLEILSTIDEYLKNRLKTPNNVGFNELIKYLNTFISCK